MPETLTITCVECGDGSDGCVCHQCRQCHAPSVPDELYEIDGDSYCDDCSARCYDCSDRFVNDSIESIEIRDGSRRTETVSLCESCRDERYACDDCGAYVDSDELNSCGDDHSVCERCNNNYSSCENCGEVYHCDNGRSCDCRDEDEEDDDKVIRPYSEKVTSSCVGRGPIFFGVELEVTDTRGEAEDAAGTVQSIFDSFAIMKADGSIGDDGFEIVTRPASLDEQKKHWDEFFRNSVTRRLRSWDGGKCGLHVHVSRRPLSALQLGKILWFVNEPSHTGFIERIAGRDSEQWAKRIKKKVTAGLCKNCDGDRYQAINLLNHNTIEFRLFRGTLKRESFYRCLEFVAAVVRWCALPTGLAPSIESFKQWLETEKKEYQNLYEFVFPGKRTVSAGRQDDSGN